MGQAEYHAERTLASSIWCVVPSMMAATHPRVVAVVLAVVMASSKLMATESSKWPSSFCVGSLGAGR